MITCPMCQSSFKQLTYSHLKNHSLTTEQFDKRFPNYDRGYSGTCHPWYGKQLPAVMRTKIGYAMRGNKNGSRRKQRRKNKIRVTNVGDIEWRRRISIAMRGKQPWNRMSNTMLRHKLQTLARELGRVPTQRDMNQSTGYPDRKAYVRAFGSWKAAVAAAGFLPHAKYGVIGLAKDGHRCHSVPKIVIDDWLTAHRVPHNKDMRYPEQYCTVDWSVGDVFIEFFGIKNNRRYARTTAHKRSLCKQLGIELVELYPEDLAALDKKLHRLVDQCAPVC